MILAARDAYGGIIIDGELVHAEVRLEATASDVNDILYRHGVTSATANLWGADIATYAKSELDDLGRLLLRSSSLASSLGRAQGSAIARWYDTVTLLGPQNLVDPRLRLTFTLHGEMLAVRGEGATGTLAGVKMDADSHFGRAEGYYREALNPESYGGDWAMIDGWDSWHWIGDEYTAVFSANLPLVPVEGGYLINWYTSLYTDALVLNGVASSDASHTAHFTSLTFADGSTPESLGYAVSFESGMASPNALPSEAAAAPEPGSVTLMSVSGLGLAFGAWRRKRKLGRDTVAVAA
ncbi:PEP-CTERM sorting domain-containing protein [Alienimonas californiensis]|uniref:PEP-CTERM sorting domain-containing protein n=1 Tax=Alienimonas californiensis TaxID=2527989 RepID=UPI0011A44121|nr:PEP-CTERM sorting domain-containing protein [Alienimonas californiensis]